jgi:hypothetical protein
VAQGISVLAEPHPSPSDAKEMIPTAVPGLINSLIPHTIPDSRLLSPVFWIFW